jgi:hypothetical protein
MVEAAPSSPFEVAEPNLLFEFLVVTFDAPAQFEALIRAHLCGSSDVDMKAEVSDSVCKPSCYFGCVTAAEGFRTKILVTGAVP